jgi:hypothetical protein
MIDMIVAGRPEAGQAISHRLRIEKHICAYAGNLFLRRTCLFMSFVKWIYYPHLLFNNLTMSHIFRIKNGALGFKGGTKDETIIVTVMISVPHFPAQFYCRFVDGLSYGRLHYLLSVLENSE